MTELIAVMAFLRPTHGSELRPERFSPYKPDKKGKVVAIPVSASSFLIRRASLVLRNALMRLRPFSLPRHRQYSVRPVSSIRVRERISSPAHLTANSWCGYGQCPIFAIPIQRYASRSHHCRVDLDSRPVAGGKDLSIGGKVSKRHHRRADFKRRNCREQVCCGLNYRKLSHAGGGFAFHGRHRQQLDALVGSAAQQTASPRKPSFRAW